MSLTDPIPYGSHRLIRTRREVERVEMARNMRRVVIEGASVSEINPKAKAGGDKKRLRGIPALAQGVGGAMQDTRPEQAVLRLDFKGGRQS